MITTVYEDGFSWVCVDDKAWSQAESMDFIEGVPVPPNYVYYYR